jgi:hypothetical protein
MSMENEQLLDLFNEFDEMDLIEARTREAVSLETDLAFYLRELGLPDTKVVMGGLDEDPLISVHGLLLTGDEASELIRRLDPKWEGQSCQRSWKGLPDDDILKLPEEEEEKTKAEMMEEKLQQKCRQRPRNGRGKEGEEEGPLPLSEREAAQDSNHVSPPPPCPALPAEGPPPTPPPPLSRREKVLAKQALAIAKSKGKDTDDPDVRRRAIAASIEAMRKKSKVVR